MNYKEKKNMKERPDSQSARRRLLEIIDEAERAAEIYPGFDLDREFENPVFRRLTAAGVPVISAYELVHRDEVNTILIEKAVKQAEKRITSAIQSGSKRPGENGVSCRSSAVASFDPRKMSKEERKSIKERVRRGESISF